MKLVVDKDKCIGCGACVAISPNNFDFDEDGLSSVIAEEVTDETRNAIDACPVYAISIDESASQVEKDKKHVCSCGEECSCGDEWECGDECNCESNGCCCENSECEYKETEEDEFEEAA